MNSQVFDTCRVRYVVMVVAMVFLVVSAVYMMISGVLG